MKPLSAPLDAQIEVTEACNLCCVHCYNYWRKVNCCRESLAMLSTEQLTQIIGALSQVGVFEITLTGGEPLLRPTETMEGIAFAKSLGLEVGLNTNATLVSKSKAIDLQGAGLDHVLVSLLGSEDVHDAICGYKGMWKLTCAGIQNLVAAGVNVAISLVISKHNLGEVAVVGKLAKELGVITFCATPMTPAKPEHLNLVLSATECKEMLSTLILVGEREKINIDTLEPLPRCMFEPDEDERFERFFGNRLCGAGVSSCVVSAKGDVRPCIHADVSYGNLLEEDFHDVWSRMDGWRCVTMLPTDCQRCSAVGICEGGCRMSGKLCHGSYNAPDLYMTTPIDDAIRLQCVHSSSTPIVIEGSKRIYFNDKVRIRREIFGGVTYQRGRIDFFSERGINLLKYLQDCGNVMVDDFCRDKSCTIEQSSVVIARLARSHIVTIQ